MYEYIGVIKREDLNGNIRHCLITHNITCRILRKYPSHNLEIKSLLIVESSYQLFSER